MLHAERHWVRVKPGGLIEIVAPSLSTGALAEVIVVAARSEAKPVDDPEVAALFVATQALPQARTFTEADILAEIAAVRAGR